MQFLSAYERMPERSSRGRYFAWPIPDGFVLTPKSARAITKTLGFASAVIYQDNRTINGVAGTVSYRVYESGRTRRRWFPYWDESPAQTIRAEEAYQ